MKDPAIRFLKPLLLLALLAYLFLGIDLSAAWETLARFSLLGIFLLALLTVAGDLVIARRWVFLSPRPCPFAAAFESFIVSAFLNNILPAKLGELSRVYYLKRVYAIRAHNGFSILLVERFFDLLMLGSLAVAATFFSLPLPGMQEAAMVLLALFWGSLFLLRRKKGFLLSLTRIIPHRTLRIYAKKVIWNMHRMMGWRTIAGAVGYTGLLWLVYLLITALFLQYVARFDLPLSGHFVVFVVSAVAMSIPLAPAGAGAYHAGLVLALQWYGVEKEAALAASVVLHLIQVVPPALIAAAVLYRKDLSPKAFIHGKEG